MMVAAEQLAESCEIVLSEDQTDIVNQVLALHEGGKRHAFITGAAGTGKSFVTRMLQKTFRDNGLEVATTATTGVAAMLNKGVTLHRFLGATRAGGFSNDPAVVSRIANTEVLFIDEVSMLSAKFMDVVFERLHKHNFGGFVIAVGDFYQLPPVPDRVQKDKGDFCFDADAWNAFDTFELTTQHRSSGDDEFNAVLSRLRNARLKGGDISVLLDCEDDTGEEIDATHIFGTRAEAQEHNNESLKELEGPSAYFESRTTVSKIGYSEACKQYRLPLSIELRIGARVMFLVNDPQERYVNGTTGVVRTINDDCLIVTADDTDEDIYVDRYEEEIFGYVPEESAPVVIAAHKQFPLMLAYGVTVHKAQGATMSLAVCDCKRYWAPGQHYVAISRLTSLDGLVLRNFNAQKVAAAPSVRAYYRKNGRRARRGKEKSN